MKSTSYLVKRAGVCLKKRPIYTTKPHESETIAKIKYSFLKEIPSHTEILIGVTGLVAPDLLIEIEAIVVMY